ncbi:Tho complex subunit 7-domain-containing protein [Phaeosphaeriaceae sp. PMI808]|nr:Tho complex subunit 7-domain-containing protein [Phaeosphaeriaceae sp. PMI808]
MVITNWGTLPQHEEDALHNVSRLLAVEARPYMHVAGHVLKPGFFENARPRQLPSPPPDASAADEEAAAMVVEREQEIHKVELWRKNIMNELSALDFAILRAEFTTTSNLTERERYAVEKDGITAKQQHVKDTIEELRVQLVEAKETLAVRKTYDELTEKISSSKMLKPRDEQALAHAKLDEEIAELEHEVRSAKDTWSERRAQFGRIEDATREMLRMIKDEKEEAERKEGMMKDGDEEGEGEGSTSRGDASRVGTPRPDGAMTPIHPSQSGEGSSSLKVPPKDRLHPLSRDTSVAPSPARSGAVEDTEMADQGANSDGDSSGLEEGEDLEDGEDDGGSPSVVRPDES